MTQMERYGLTEKEAKIKEQVLLFTRKKPLEQIEILHNHGCPQKHTRNATTRRKAYHNFLATDTFESAVPDSAEPSNHQAETRTGPDRSAASP